MDSGVTLVIEPVPEASLGRWVFEVTGMTCASCVGSVTSLLREIPGVETVDVNLITQKATVGGQQSMLSTG